MADQWDSIDRYLREKGVRIGTPTRGQTVGGRHAMISNHYFGDARDYGVHDSDAAGVARALELIALQPHGPISKLYFSRQTHSLRMGKDCSDLSTPT